MGKPGTEAGEEGTVATYTIRIATNFITEKFQRRACDAVESGEYGKLIDIAEEWRASAPKRMYTQTIGGSRWPSIPTP